MEIIQPRELIENEWHERSFQNPEFDNGEYFTGGFAFKCSPEGVVDETDMNPAALENLRKCLDGTMGFIDYGVRECSSSGWTCKIGRCDCGEEVYLDGFTNTCDGCNADYNGSGQRLADRSHWGEETGESLADILSIP